MTSTLVILARVSQRISEGKFGGNPMSDRKKLSILFFIVPVNGGEVNWGG